MRIEISCWKCIEGKTGHVQTERIDLPIADSNLYRGKCSQGHDVAIVLQNPRHEILAENAVWAIADGYNREGVASFAAALERFYEFYFKAVAKAYGIDPDEFAKTWDIVTSQSERQFGLYLAAYLFENKASAPFLPPGRKHSKDVANVAFRNMVIHKGHIPDENGAIKFGQAVVDLIDSVMATATDRLRSAISDLQGEQLVTDLGLQPLDERGQAPSMWLNNILAFAGNGTGDTNVARAVEQRQQDRAFNRQLAVNEGAHRERARAQRHLKTQQEMLAARLDR